MDKKQRIGKYVTSTDMGPEPYKTYVPQPLPPNPALDLAELYPYIDRASTALGRLDGMSLILPETSLFLYMYVRKEAVLSSQIEGTQSSLSDLLLFEDMIETTEEFDDVAEVSSYVSAMNYGLERLETFPLSLRLLREIHAKLMANSRGSDKSPGEFRRSQNWIGGTRPGNAFFVPPEIDAMTKCLNDFERFLHDDTVNLPVLIKAGLAHVQFETIHPFLDGNGRLGRLLITFILCHEKVLKLPLLYLSLYFKQNQQAYYQHLQDVRETGDWEGWLKFFLEGVSQTATSACESVQRILALFQHDQKTIEASSATGAGVLSVFHHMQKKPITSATHLQTLTGLSHPTVMRALNHLQELNIVTEITGKPRKKVFAYQQYLNILSDT